MTTQRSPAPDWQTCLSEDVILAFQRGEATPAEREHIHQHVDSCEHCRGLVMLAAQLAEVTGDGDVDNSNRRLASFMASGFPWRTFSDGKRLAKRFDIVRFVERGGMGEVYEAHDSVLGSRVALKTLLVTTTDNSGALDRLSQEVNLARRVAHPHVCRIYDLHEHRERGHRPMRFLAMEFIDGETLKARLQESELTVAEACAIARQLLLGLGAIHAAGVLHLDFKSQNVMLRAGETPPRAVVMDFSLSRAFDTELRLRTSERQLAGSVGYMSPEQLECQDTLGPASDVYAFGVVLFEMLTRRMAFDGDSPAAIMLKQLKGSPPAPSSLRAGITPALDELVLTCLRRQPRARFQTVESVLVALDRCLRQHEVRVPRGAPRWRRVAVAGALTASVVGSLIALDRASKWRASEAAVAPALPRVEGDDERAAPLGSPVPTVPPAMVPPATVPPATVPPATVPPTAPPAAPVAPALADPRASPNDPAAAEHRSGVRQPPESFPRRESSEPTPRARASASARAGAPRMRPSEHPQATSSPEPAPSDQAPPSEAPPPNAPMKKPAREPWKPERAPDFLL